MSDILLVANWKMNGSQELVKNMQAQLEDINVSAVDIVICPPFPFIQTLLDKLPKSISIGAQNCFAGIEDYGAFTGEISSKILKDIGCKYVIVGHSERRALLSEESDMVRVKAEAVLNSNMIPIICYGETLEVKQQGNTHDFLRQQLDASIPTMISSNIILAYEPVWAIGSGKIPTIDEILDVGRITREFIKNKYGAPSLQKLKILYGGSVNVENIRNIVINGAMDGVLVGGVSLKPDVFVSLIKAL